MKRYLLVGIAVLFVSSNASLKEEFAQMDLAQEQLLNDIRKSPALSGEDDNNEDVKEYTVVPVAALEPGVTNPTENDVEMADSVAAVISELDSVVNESDHELRADAIRKKVMLEVEDKDEAQAPSSEILDAEFEKEKEERAGAEIAVKEAELKKIKEAEEKKVAEQREVEAYEKQRAEKIAKEAVAEASQKAELEKKQLAQKALEEAEYKEKIMVNTSIGENKELASVTSTEESTLVEDINVTREKEEANIAADKAYEEAVKEMGKED